VGFAARPLSLRFTATEVARFAAVISLVSLAASWQRDLAA
jgi:hypothetical protein